MASRPRKPARRCQLYDRELRSAGRIRPNAIVARGPEIVPGISVEVFPATPATSSHHVRGGGQTACYISDLIPTSAHVDLNWVMAFDLYPMETVESRKRYYSRAIPERWLTMFTHDPEIPWGYLEKDEQWKNRDQNLIGSTNGCIGDRRPPMQPLLEKFFHADKNFRCCLRVVDFLSQRRPAGNSVREP